MREKCELAKIVNLAVFEASTAMLLKPLLFLGCYMT